MASVTGSRLAFFTGAVSDSSKINVVLTVDGNDVSGKAIAGDFNIEVFTATPPANATIPASGFQAAALIEGAQQLTNNAIQAGAPNSAEKLLAGNVILMDLSGGSKRGESIQIAGKVGDSITVYGSSGDTITGSADPHVSQVIDATAKLTPPENNPGPFVGPETIIGGAGATTIRAGQGDLITSGAGGTIIQTAPGDTITGGTGALQVNDDVAHAGNVTVTGGTGHLDVFNIGKDFSVTGGTVGTTSFDDTYSVGGAAQGGGSSIVGGSGTSTLADGENTLIVAAAGDHITVGSGLTYIVDKGSDSILGGNGTSTGTVAGAAGFNTNILSRAGDVITLQSAKTYVTATDGKTSITGGSGFAHIQAGNSDVITGSKGDLEVVNIGNKDQITGGTGNITVSGAGIDTSITGGSKETSVIAASGDSVTGGSGTLNVDFDSDQSSTTVDLSKGAGAATLRDVSVTSGTGQVSVTGFSTSIDAIASKTSVDSTGTFLGTSKSDGAGGTILTFLDGTQMTLAGVSDITKVKFTQ